MKFGLSKRDEDYLAEAFSKFPEIEKAVIFGSRALGNHKPGSDVDLALVGENITPMLLLRLRSMLNEDLPLPYFFDVAHYEKIKNEKLKQHIDEEGQTLFCRAA